MGTFEGHLLPGAAFVLLGLWHMYNTIIAYVSGPSSFHTRAWFPASLPGRWKYVELFLIVFGACASIAAEMVISQPGHWMLDPEGHIPVHMLAQFEHASMSLFFLLYALVALFTEGAFIPHLKPLPFGFLHLLGGAALAQEFLLFFFHSGDHMGLEGQFHMLLRIPIAIGLACILLEICWPQSVILPLVRSASMCLQGLLLMQTAFTIWVPAARPLHCHPVEDNHVRCENEVWTHRAQALATLQFNWWSAALLIFVVVFYLVLRSIYGKDAYLPLRGADVETELAFADTKPAKTLSSDSGDEDPRKEYAVPAARHSSDEEMGTTGFAPISVCR